LTIQLVSGRDALLPHLRQPLAGDLNVDSGEKWYIPKDVP
jgi:hypothetical protein